MCPTEALRPSSRENVMRIWPRATGVGHYDAIPGKKKGCGKNVDSLAGLLTRTGGPWGAMILPPEQDGYKGGWKACRNWGEFSHSKMTRNVSEERNGKGVRRHADRLPGLQPFCGPKRKREKIYVGRERKRDRYKEKSRKGLTICARTKAAVRPGSFLIAEVRA